MDPIDFNESRSKTTNLGKFFYNRNGKKHRIEGPASEYFDGRKEWWIHGVQLTELEHFLKIKEAN